MLNRFKIRGRRVVSANTCAALAALVAGLSVVLRLWGGLGDQSVLGKDIVLSGHTSALALLLVSLVALATSFWPTPRVRRGALLVATTMLLASAGWIAHLGFGLTGLPGWWLHPAGGEISLGALPTLKAGVLVLLPAAWVFLLLPAGLQALARPTVTVIAIAVGLVGVSIPTAYALGVPMPLTEGRQVPLTASASLIYLLLAANLVLRAGRKGLHKVPTISADEPVSRPRGRGLLTFLAFVVAVAVPGAFYLRYHVRSARSAAQEEMRVIGDLKARQVADWHQRWRADALVFVAPAIEAMGASILRRDISAGDRAKVTAWAEKFLAANRYERIAVYDRDGVAQLTVKEPGTLVDAACKDHLADALKSSGPLLTDLHAIEQSGVAGRPLLRLSIWVPIGAKTDSLQPADGTWLIQVDPDDVLYPLIQSWPTPSKSAETLLVRREGNEVVYLNELRHRQGTALKLRFPVAPGSQLPAAMAVLGYEGVAQGIDYRGIPVLSAVRRVPGTPWFIVAKVDVDEVFAPLRGQALAIGLVLLLLAAASALTVGILDRHRTTAWLEQRVRDRTAELAVANRELEAFSYSVSHDLRSPLRGIDGWSMALTEDCADRLDDKGHSYIERIRGEVQRMGTLIDDLLQLARVTRTKMAFEQVDLSRVAEVVTARLREVKPDHRVHCTVQPGMVARGDPRLLEVILTNLFDNAWKYTRDAAVPRVEFGVWNGATFPSPTTGDDQPTGASRVFFVRDNGAGFDMTYSQKLFGAFQRMHGAKEFPGTGIGLATVHRLVHRHGGRAWAHARVGEGATIFFTLEGTT